MLAALNCCSKASRICFELDGNNCYITFVLSNQRLNPLYSCKKPSPSDRTSPGWWRIKVEPWPSWGGADGNRYGMFYGVTLSKDCIAKATFSFWILRALRIPKLHGSGTWQTSGGQIHIADRQSWISWIPHPARHRHVCQPYDCRSCGGDVWYTDMTGLYNLYLWIPQDSDLIRKNCQDMASFMATGPGPPVSTAMIWCVLLCQDLEIWRAISMYFLCISCLERKTFGSALADPPAAVWKCDPFGMGKAQGQRILNWGSTKIRSTKRWDYYLAS